MGVGGVDRCAHQPAPGFRTGQEVVAAAQLRQPTPLHQHRRHPLLSQHRSSPFHIGGRGDGQATQQASLVKVGGEQVGQGQQLIAVGLDRLGLQQHRPSPRHHYRIDQLRDRQGRQGPGRGLYQAAVEQHAGLEGRHRQIAEHRLDLGRERLGRQGINPANAAGVLGGDTAQGRAAVNLQRHEGLQIGLNTRTTAGITTADGERDRRSCYHDALGHGPSACLRAISCPTKGNIVGAQAVMGITRSRPACLA